MKIKEYRRNKKQNIRFRRQNKKKKKNEWQRKKYKNARETLKIIKKIIDYNKDAQNFFHHASKVDKKIKIKDWKKCCRKDEIKKTKIECNCKKEKKKKRKNKQYNF